MECGQCGTANRENARFCNSCGSPLARHCAACNVQLAPGARFCDECGTPVVEVAPAGPTAAAPALSAIAVRKTVTVVFCDLGGSTRFGEHTDAELAREVMARYHAILQEVIDAHGGTVAKFMGDGMMALFGIPEIAEDDAARAVRAGAEIQDRFGAFAADVATRHRETLTMRVGVNTGEVVIARGDADLVGDALNVAARLEKACRPGHVLVGEETWRLTRGAFGYEPLGEVTVAGREQAVSIYELTLDAARAVEPVAPFVGRDAEMQRLLTVFDLATTSRSAQLATVLGSPGVGKTRLSREFCAKVESGSGAVTFEIRCDRAGDATFAPIASLIREATGLGDDADGPTARSHVSTLLSETESDRERLVDVLAGLVGAARARSVEETFWAIRRLVESLATAHPVAIVIDDIQWAEPLLLDLLEHLTEWVRDVPVMLVCLARPELRDVRPAFAETGRRVADVLALDGLDSVATEQLAAGLLGTDRLPAGLIARLPTSTDGNPLFVRELVRMLVDDRVIRQRDGEWELTIDADAVEVPPTIQSLLAARVERLPNNERELLEFASVVGAEFSLGAVRELAGPDVAIAGLLEGMRRKELVEPTGTYWGDEPVHRFHHVLIRDAAYRRLLKTTRAELHERVGVWTDRTAQGLIGEHEAVIAYHYEQAYQYRRELGADDDRVDDLGRRAAQLLATAANRALGRDDLAAAGALARRAIQLLPEQDTTARAELLLVGCECLLASGDVGAGRPLVAQLSKLAAGDPGLQSWAMCFEAQLTGLTSPEGLVGADTMVTAAAETLNQLGDSAGEAKAHQVRAGLLARLGRVGEAEEELQLALEAARSVDDRRRVTAVLGAAPTAALFGPSPVARAGGRCLDVVRLLRITTASPSVEATSMRCQAVLEALRGRFDVSRAMIASARASLEELGLRHGLMDTELFAGMVELIAGDPAAAIAPLRAAYGGLGAMGVGADAGQAAALLGRALLALGNVDEADEMASASEHLAGQNLKTAIAWRVARAEVLAARGDIAAGIALAEAAVEIAAATDYMIDHADACVALMGLREAAGDAAGAGEARAEALRLYEAKGATVPAQRLGADDAEPTRPAAPAASSPARVSTSGSAPSARVENASTQLIARFFQLAVERRFDEAVPLLAATHRMVDRRRTVSGPTTTTNADAMALLRAALDIGFVAIDVEPLAIRGDRLNLSRFVYRTTPGSEVVAFGLNENNAAGVCAYTAWFDEDDLDAATEELEERYIAGEGAPHVDALRVLIAMARGIRRRDWDGLRGLMAPDFISIDRRQVGFPELDRDSCIASWRESIDLAPDRDLIPRVVNVVGRAVLASNTVHGTSQDGGAYEWPMHVLVMVDASGSVSRLETFPEESFDAALARLDELGAARTSTGPVAGSDAPRLENVATRTLPDGETIAVRGERLGLSRMTRAADESRAVVLTEVDDNGRPTDTVTFDESDLLVAFDELERRYCAGEGAEHEYIVSRAVDFVGALHRRDWGACEAVYSPRCVGIDHRKIGHPISDRSSIIGMLRALVDLVPDLVQYHRWMLVRGDVALVLIEAVGTTPEGSHYSWLDYSIFRFAAGRIVRIEIFDVEQYDDAHARFEDLAAEARTPFVDNPALRSVERGNWLESFGGGSITGYLAEDLAVEDRRSGVSLPPLRGADAVTEASQAQVDLFGPTAFEPVAVRGDRLMLVGTRAVATSGFELMAYGIFEMNPAGQLCSMIFFDDSDLRAALETLDARYEEIREDQPGACERVLRRDQEAWAQRDFHAVEALYAPEFVLSDHRPLGFADARRAEYLDRSWMLVEAAPDLIAFARKAFVSDRAALVVMGMSGTTPEGNEYTWELFCVVKADAQGRFERIEYFPDDRWADALVLFDEWASEPVMVQVENKSSLMVREALTTFSTGAIDEAARYLAENIERIDRRRGVAAPSGRGREAFLENTEAILDVFGTVTVDTVAVRGERLALVRYRLGQSDGFHMLTLAVCEADADGLFACQVTFEDDDVVAALAELEDRYCVGEGAEHEYLVRRFGDLVPAYGRHDWSAIEAFIAPDCVAVDQRSIGMTWSDRESLIASNRALADLAPDIVVVPRSLVCRGDAVLSQLEMVGTTVDGNRYEWSYLVVVRYVAGLAADIDAFDLEANEQAEARLADLAAKTRTPDVDNAIVRTIRRADWLAEFGDATASLAYISEDIVGFDRRSGVSLPPLMGRQAFAEASIATSEVMHTSAFEQLAVRGERLALVRVRRASPDGFDICPLALLEADTAGRLCRRVIFDEGDIAAAIEELESRYRELRGNAYSPVERSAADLGPTFNSRDWGRVRAQLSEHLVGIDHEPVGFGTIGIDEYINGALQGLVELAPDVRVVCSKVSASGAVALARLDTAGSTREGNSYQWCFVYVMRIDADELIDRIESFREDRWDDAVALFDEWACASQPSEVENAVSRSVQAALALCAQGKIDEAGARYTAAEVERLDRRRSVSAPSLRGREVFNESVRAIFEVFGTITAESIAVRGERLALMRVRFAAPDGFEQMMLTLYEADANGLQARLVTFDEDDLVAALAELEHRYCAGEGAEHEYLVRRVGDGLRSCARGEWSALERLFSPDLRAVDHRLLGFPLSDRASFVEMQRSLEQVAPGAVPVFATLEVSGNAVLGLVETRGTSADGNRYEWGSVTVSRNVGGLVSEIELFGSDQVDAARARFEAWAEEKPTPDIDNDAVRAVVRAEWLAEFGDAAGVLNYIAEDIVAFDRRSGVSLPAIEGRQAFVDFTAATKELFGASRHEPMAVRGERLVLNRIRLASAEGFELSGLAVIEIDTSGRASRSVIFDESDLVAAIEELESRYRDICGDAYPLVERAGTLLEFNARDWDAIVAKTSPHFVCVDHAPLGFGTLDRAGYIDGTMRALVEVAPDVCARYGKLYASGRISLSRLDVTGTTPEGNRYSWVYIYVARIGSDGLIERIESFAEDQWDDAVALYDEWSTTPR